MSKPSDELGIGLDPLLRDYIEARLSEVMAPVLAQLRLNSASAEGALAQAMTKIEEAVGLANAAQAAAVRAGRRATLNQE